MVQRKCFTNKCQRKQTNSLGKIVELFILNSGTTRKITMRNNQKLGLLSKQLYLCRYKVSHIFSLYYLFKECLMQQDPLFFPHTCEHQNPITLLHYFSIGEFCQPFQRHLWVVSDSCDILFYFFAFLLKLPLMSELLLVVSAILGKFQGTTSIHLFSKCCSKYKGLKFKCLYAYGFAWLNSNQ